MAFKEHSPTTTQSEKTLKLSGKNCQMAFLYHYVPSVPSRAIQDGSVTGGRVQGEGHGGPCIAGQLCPNAAVHQRKARGHGPCF